MSDVRRIKEGLVGEEHAARYHTNAWFRYAVDNLASMLPFFIAGLAAEADEKNARFRAEIRTLEQIEAGGAGAGEREEQGPASS